MKFRYAMVCSSNQNRSMEAHFLLKKQGLDISSYGTGAHVKLPGPSLREPNVYDFGTPYKHMFDDLRRKDPELYPFFPHQFLTPVFSFSSKSTPQIVDLHNRNHVLMKTVLIINLEVKDNHDEAAIGARITAYLCQEIEAVESWEESIDDIVAGFEKQHRQKLFECWSCLVNH
ncbi:hypothetical protein TanjilG_05144 [Lupinus angustifolius]|uniref:RNA polymerase II subunit A C-terminal domain phosphatase SSU72 n=1 Tax=Lupinus angustifolius TaxID=3871 RepID=A0A394DEC6_LUPAN|nr:hypothetical protein TanjilG_05144 [Lupinus angustifolius]